jgi:SAM-dependent methyltransferase
MDRLLREIVLDHLCLVPMHRAVVRSVEAAKLRALELEAPVLDAGCGDGVFASLALSRPADLGVDSDVEAALEASARRWHRLIAVSDLRALPFASESFGSVVCNSVIEHVPDVDKALAELARVLKSGGRLIITTPLPTFTELLLTCRVLDAIGLHGLAEAYGRWFNRLSRHYHFFGVGEWERRLREVGLELLIYDRYLDGTAMAVFEMAHYLDAFRLILKHFWGRWVLFPKLARRSPLVRLKARLLAAFGAREPKERAGYLFLLARKAGPTGDVRGHAT